MIDIESLVFDTVYNYLSPLYPAANITAGFDEKEESAMTIVVRETNNVPYQASITDDCAENHSRLTYEVEVKSTREGTGRSECKQVLSDADTVMQSMKFRRIHKSPPFIVDRTGWRQYARYEVIVGKGITRVTGTGENPETTTTFQMYRR